MKFDVHFENRIIRKGNWVKDIQFYEPLCGKYLGLFSLTKADYCPIIIFYCKVAYPNTLQVTKILSPKGVVPIFEFLINEADGNDF